MSDLNKYIAVYIPTKDAKGESTNDEVRTKLYWDVQKQFAEAFGNFTQYETFGGRIGDKGDLITERVTIIKSFYDGADGVPFRFARTLALVIKWDMKQEAVTIEQNGGITFI